MSQVTCRYCGLPFRVRRVEPGRDYFCCTGCSILGRVPIDASGNYPVNEQLVSALTVGFLYFNQVLATAVSLLLRKQDELQLADRFAWIAAGAALIVWLAVVFLQGRLNVRRGKDIVFALLALAILGSSFTQLPPRGALLVAGNAVLLIWNVRGLLRPHSRATTSGP
jgi:hypothetical protein